MKRTKNLLTRPTVRGLVMALAVAALSSQVARAVPYASSVVSNNNTVTFVLNQNAQGLVVLRNGANPVYPGTTAGPLSFDMTGYTSYQIIVTGVTTKGWSQFIPDGTDRNFYYPPSAVVNKNPASTNFGKVYIVNSRAATTGAGRACLDGVYVLRADGVALNGTPYTGGVDWTVDTTASTAPFKSCIGPDDHLYVTSYFADMAYEFNADLSVATPLLEAANKTTGQYVESIWVEGTKATGDRKVYLLNSHYLDARVGLIRYDLGSADTAIGLGTGTQEIGPSFFTYYPRDVARDRNGFWYLSNYRASTGQAAAINKFDGSLTPPINASVWDTGMGYTYTLGLGLNEAGGTVAVGSVSGVGPVYFFDMATGAFVEQFRAGNNIRRVAFDAAGNMITVDNSLEYARFWSPGGFTVATTGSGGTFSVVKPSVNVSVTASPDTTSMDLNQPPGVFTLARDAGLAGPLTVGYTLTGTATNNVQYQLLSGKVTFQAGDATTNINVTAIPYLPAGPTRSVILSINTSNTYSPTVPFTATVWIVDTNKPVISVVAKDTQFYERTNDFARFTLTRLGDTNLYLGAINLTYGGTATAGTQFDGPAAVSMNVGEVTLDVKVTPIHDGVVTGPKTVTATVAAAGDSSYTVGAPATSGAVTRVDADDPPETVIWSDNFSTDSSANWTVLFATTNDVAQDYCINATPDGISLPLIGTWPYDYSALVIPSAPHTTDGSTKGLYLTVNKTDATPAAAALNLYPKLQSFSGNYALRFDMFLIRNTTSGQTEYALFGINHSGTKTNWFRNSAAGYSGVDPVGWDFDGIFYNIESDGAALGDYASYSSPTTASRNPTPIPAGPAPGGGRWASTMEYAFKSPPWVPTAGNGGAPANNYGTATPIWADVELRQVNGIISWFINHELIWAYTNASGYTSGNIMLGYTDAYDSIGSAGGAVIYANARVISLARPIITQIVRNAGNAEITFTANAGDVIGQFVLQSASVVNGTYLDTSSTITSLGGGAFKAVKLAGASAQYYRIRRVE